MSGCFTTWASWIFLACICFWACSLCSNLLPTKKRAKVCRKIENEELNTLVNEYQVFIYTDDEKLSGKYLLTSNPVVRPLNKTKDLVYDLILK